MSKKKKVRRRYSKEFKEDACLLVLDEGRSKADVARSLGVNPASLGNWVKEFQKDRNSAFPGNGRERLTEEQKKIKELEKELRQARMERDILKKAITFVANPPD